MPKVHFEEEETEGAKLFWSSDLGLAAILSQKFKLEQINPQNPQRVEFAFKSSEELEVLVRKYWDKKLLIEPQEFSHQVLILRKRIVQELNNHEN